MEVGNGRKIEINGEEITSTRVRPMVSGVTADGRKGGNWKC